MQLLARKAKTVDPDTMELCRSMVDEFPHLAKERVYEEFYKLLVKAPRPSSGLEFLRESGWIKWFPELEALIGCPQNPEYHPEGDVWQHTLNVVDNAAQVRRQLSDEDRAGFMFGALCHDLGKPETTDRDTFTAYAHDTKGEDKAVSFMERITNSKKLLEVVPLLTVSHMQPHFLSKEDKEGNPLTGPKAWKKLYNKLNGRLDMLGWLSRADWAGSVKFGERSASDVFHQDHRTSGYCFTWFNRLEAEGPEIKPILMGRDLIAAGMKPGPEFKECLSKAYEAQMDGVEDKIELLEIALG